MDGNIACKIIYTKQETPPVSNNQAVQQLKLITYTIASKSK